MIFHEVKPSVPAQLGISLLCQKIKKFVVLLLSPRLHLYCLLGLHTYEADVSRTSFLLPVLELVPNSVHFRLRSACHGVYFSPVLWGLWRRAQRVRRRLKLSLRFVLLFFPRVKFLCALLKQHLSTCQVRTG